MNNLLGSQLLNNLLVILSCVIAFGSYIISTVHKYTRAQIVLEERLKTLAADIEETNAAVIRLEDIVNQVLLKND